MLYQLVMYPGDKSQILTTSDQALWPRIASIEAALNVCETFAALALLLFVIAAWKLHARRFFSVAAIGILCFSAEMVLFGLAPQSSIDKSRLSRPFLLNEKAIIIPTSMVVAILAILGGVLWIYTPAETLAAIRARALTRNHRQDHESQNDIQMVHPQLPAEDIEAYLNRVSATLATSSRRPDQQAHSIRVMTLVTVLFLPLSFFATAGLPLGLMGVTAIGALHDFAWRLPFFLPESSSSFLDLDQSVAFAGGLATICFSSLEAYSTRRDEQRDDSE